MIWIVGNKGMLGTELGLAMEAAGLSWIGSDREVDATDPDAVRHFAQEHKPRWFINCAAYTAVDKAEDPDQLELCTRLNEGIPRVLGTVARETGAWVIHISTDYVFDGQGITGSDGKLRPWREDDPVGPQGVYGATKARGEDELRKACPNHLIIRTAWLYGTHGPNFVYTMLRFMKEREGIGVIHDQYGTPTWAGDLARALVALVGAPVPVAGTYHYSGVGTCTWYDFAREIHRLGRLHGLLERDCEIKPLSTDQYPTKARRPAWSVLDKTRISSVYGLEIKNWQDSLVGWFESVTRFTDDKNDLFAMAAYDLETARHMLSSGRYLYVAYTVQQALEKALKARVCLWEVPRRIHDLVSLATQAQLSLNGDELGMVSELTRFYLKHRYPEDFSKLLHNCDEDKARGWIQGAEALWNKIKQHPLL